MIEDGNTSSEGPGEKRQRLTVDGEVFEVREWVRMPGDYDFFWLTGPNEGFGFSLGTSSGGSLTPEELEEHASQWLASIDPETGYTSDDEDDHKRDPSKPPLGWPPS